MAPPLTLDGSAKTGSAGRDLLRLKISSDNVLATIYVNGANAGRLGLQVWDESHAQYGNLHAYSVDAEAAGGFSLAGTRVLSDDGYLRLVHGSVGVDPEIALGHSGTDPKIYHDADAHNFRALAGSPIFGTIDSGGLTIFSGATSRITILSSNTAYGWRIDTSDLGGGDVPLRIYKRTASVDTLALTIKNQDGSAIFGGIIRTESTAGSPTGASGLGLELYGIISGESYLQAYNRTSSAYGVLHVDASAVKMRSGLALDGALVWQTDATYDVGASGATRPRHGYFSGTVTANAFAGDGSALTNLPAATPLNNQSVASISNTVKLTYSLPAGKLGTNGNALRISTRINKGASSAALNGLMKFGATTICTVSFGTVAENPEVEVIIRRTGATTQIAYARSTKGAGTSVVTRTTPSETLSGAITISWESSTTETFDAEHFVVEFIP